VIDAKVQIENIFVPSIWSGSYLPYGFVCIQQRPFSRSITKLSQALKAAIAFTIARLKKNQKSALKPSDLSPL
jgi:uncharacterized membrane protein YccC